MTEVGTGFVPVVPTMRGFHKTMRAELAGIRTTVQVAVEPVVDKATAARAQAEIADAQTEAAEATDRHTESSRRQSQTLTEATRNIDRNRVALSGLVGVLATAGVMATRAGAGVSTLAAAAYGVGGLAATLAPTVGVLGLVPAAGFAAAAGIGAVAVGVQGFGEALDSMDDPAKFAESLRELAPAARDTAVAVQALRPAYADATTAVQQQLFTGMATELRELTTAALPTLRAGLAGIATEANTAAAGVLNVLQVPGTVGDIGGIFGEVRATFANLGPAAAPLTQALRDIAVVGASFLPTLTTGLAAAAQRFAEFVAHARETGALAGFIRGALDTLSQFGGVLSNIGSLFEAVTTAANTAGFSFLGTLGTLTQSLAGFFNSAQGQTVLVSVFGTIRDTVANLLPGLQAVGVAIASGIIALGPRIPVVAAAISGIAIALAPLITDLASFAAWILPGLASAVSTISPELGPLAAGALAGVVAFKAFQGIVHLVTLATKAWTVATLLLNGALRANPVGIVITVLAGVVAAVVSVWNRFEWFRNGVTAVWNGIVAVAQWAWTNVLRPIFDGIGIIWGAIWNEVKRAWDTLGRPVWDAIAGHAQWLYNTALKPAFDWINAHWAEIWGAVQRVWDTIGRPVMVAVGVVAGIMAAVVIGPLVAIGAAFAALAYGIKWAYDNVLRPSFELFGAGIDAIGVVFDRVSQWIRDSWSRVVDYAKMPINFVIDFVYNKGIVPLWNGIAGVFGLGTLRPMALLASGGVVPGPAAPMVTNRPTAIVGEGNPRYPEYVIPTDPKYRSRALALWSSAGTHFMASGGVLGDPWARVTSVAGDVAAGIGDAFNWATSIAGDVAGGVRSLFAGVLGAGQATPGAGLWTDALRQIPGRVVDAVISRAQGWLTAAGPAGVLEPPGAGVQRWTPVVTRALSMLGQPVSLLPVVLRRMFQESGGNPEAINNWDDNARRGTPSKGLMQVIDPTFAAYRDPRAAANIWDPLANVLASMRYALARYGSLPAAYNKPGGYDRGGFLPPGLSMVYNGTGRPEPVLTRDQWDAVRSLSQAPGRGTAITVNAQTSASPEHIAASIDRRLKMYGRV